MYVIKAFTDMDGRHAHFRLYFTKNQYGLRKSFLLIVFISSFALDGPAVSNRQYPRQSSTRLLVPKQQHASDYDGEREDPADCAAFPQRL